MPRALQVEQRRRLVGVAEHVGGGLIDRHRPRAGHRVRLLARVQRQGVELQEFRIRHVTPPITLRLLLGPRSSVTAGSLHKAPARASRQWSAVATRMTAKGRRRKKAAKPSRQMEAPRFTLETV